MLTVLAAASFLASILLTNLIKRRFSNHLLDIPNDRSSHTQPTPRGGGLGFILAFAITSLIATLFASSFPQLLSHPQINPNPTFLWLILTPLAIIGIIDDRQGLPARIRYLVHLSVASLAIACFGSFPLPWLPNFGIVGQMLAIALTLIGITALINFYNFMDGLDGLVASVTALQMAFLALYLNQPLFWLLVAALLGFLWWNWSPAKIFMGDAGSTVLGASVAIALLNSHNPVQAWSALAVTLPLTADAIYTLIRRLIRQENIFKGHRSHIYQRLQQSGWTHRQVALTYLIATSIIVLLITTLGTLGNWFSLVGVLIGLAIAEMYLQATSAIV
ncbi:MraY family glycosyltransferase [Coleofasciculus sp. F4-SAH-05]|uniref:MraY family glycosyltransferase n=1 Tax=Coleofasciculus sp. F4-SAH-05 TaxID=3069525 RepID=UPI0032FA71C9